MTTQTASRSKRALFTSIAFGVALLVAAAVFHRPLVAWFTGKSLGGREGTPVSVQAGPFALTAALDPDPPQQQGNALVLEVKDTSGKPIDGANVDVFFDMPAMGAMAEMKGGAKVSPESGGRYRAAFDLPMGSGSWTLKTSIRSSQREAHQDFAFTVGRVGIEAGTGSANADTSAIDHYTCSMHPSVNEKGPGKCPICGMDLIPVTKEQQALGVVTIDEARRQLIGVRTEPVVEGPMRDAFRAVGRVTYDESALTDVNLKVRGWISKLFVSQTGQRVARGQTLFTMYSPELYNAQQDFLLSTRGATVAAAGPPDGGPTRLDSLGSAARQRLRLLGMDDAQIDAVAKKGAPVENVAVPSPASGFVIEKDVVEGASVDVGTRLYRIAALNKVWVEADVYEADLSRVHVGQPVTVTLDYLPGRSFDAKVAYVYPYLDSKARTGRVRVEIANKELDLRPGMYASIELGAALGSRVQVPAAAVVYTGPRRLVFIDLGGGRFKPQEIQVGAEANGMYEVLAGLKPGDLVATSGVFLIAAEARIGTATSYWDSSAQPEDGGRRAPAPAPSVNPMPPMPGMGDMAPVPVPKATGGGMQPTMPNTAPASSGGPDASPLPSTSSAPTPTVYSCPMHPDVRSPTPGKCPKCGMDLQPMRGKP